MHTEYEVRLLEIDVDGIKKRLEEVGAEFCWDKLQRRYVYDFIPKVDSKWIRLRTNGEKTTLTIKNLVSSEIDGTQELEIVVDNFERTNLILKELGYEAKGYQENRRIEVKDDDRPRKIAGTGQKIRYAAVRLWRFTDAGALFQAYIDRK